MQKEILGVGGQCMQLVIAYGSYWRQGNRIGEDGARDLAQMVANNTSITKLVLFVRSLAGSVQGDRR